MILQKYFNFSNKQSVVVKIHSSAYPHGLNDQVFAHELCDCIIFRSLHRFQDQFVIHGTGEK
jgi:hypothetical protein